VSSPARRRSRNDSSHDVDRGCFTAIGAPIDSSSPPPPPADDPASVRYRGGWAGGKERGMARDVSVDEAAAGLTVPRLFEATVAACREKPALRWRTTRPGDGSSSDAGADDWGQWTWGEYADLVARA